MSGVTALVLAGSRGSADPLALAEGVSHKALISIAGVPMLARVLRALLKARESGHVGRIAISIERADILEELARYGADFTATPEISVLAAKSSPAASTAAAVDALGTPLLMTTADHALLQSEWIVHFLQAMPGNMDVGGAIALEDVVRRATPETRRTFLRFSDGAFSGCNLFYLRTPKAQKLAEFWQQLESERKNPLQLLKRLGFTFAARYALGTLSRQDALNRLREMTGAGGALIEMPFGECAVDVDKSQDLELVRRILEKREGIQA